MPKLAQGFWARQSARLTDWHCHLGDIKPSELNVAEILESRHAIHHMSVTPEEFLSRIGQFSHYPQVRPSCGLYPLYVGPDSPSVELFFKLLPHCALVGEIGLDFSPQFPEPQRQMLVFEDILKACHHLGGRCLSIHSRKAGAEVFSLCQREFNGTQVLHWYSGPCDQLGNIPEHVYFSINSAMLKSRHGRQLLEQVPREKILLESDAPYLQTPSQQVMSSLFAVVQSLSLRWNMSVEDAIGQLEHNAQNALKNIRLELTNEVKDMISF